MASFFHRSPRAQATRSVRARLCLESLEERAVPATFTVTNTADSGAGSLRDAIIQANKMAGDDIINFDPTVFIAGSPINLNNANDAAGQNDGYTINDSVTINGPGVLNLTLNGAGNGGARIMTVNHTRAGDDGTASANAATPITVVINNLTFAGGNIIGQFGAALANFGDNVTLQTTHFENNTVTREASGAVGIAIGGTLTVRQSSFVNNSAENGGGAIGFAGGSGTIENSAFSGNRHTSNVLGGGAVCILFGASVTLTNNTISGNSSAAAGQGGGVLVHGTAALTTLTGNIVFGNTSAGVADDVHTQDPNDVGAGSGFNDIGVYTSAGVPAAALTAPNNGNISADPMLGALTPLANGTRAFTPAAGSPVLNTIAPASAPAVDQANNVRPAGTNSDMGAIERTLLVTNTNDSGAGSLRQSIIDANITPGADVINFDPTVFSAGKTINLDNANDTAGQNDGYTINDSVTINGPGVLNLTLKNGAVIGATRIMTVDHTAAGDDGTASANAATPITVVINNLTFAGANIVRDGGALANIGDNVTVQTTHFENNTAAGEGGAIFTTNNGILTVRQSSFVNNTGADGGAIEFDGGTGTVENSTFSGNQAVGGGAIDIFRGATVALTNNTISGNSTAVAGNGGGVRIFGNLVQATLTGNIVSGNTSNGIADDVHTDAPGPVDASSGFNDIGAYTFGGVAAAALMTGNNGNINADPLLGALTPLANGTRAFTPAAGSPVLNTIAPANAPTVDQAANARPAGTNSDMGAIERPTLVVTNTNDFGAGSLRQAIIDANKTPGADTINFDPAVFSAGSTINLSNANDTNGDGYTINDSVTINGPGVLNLTLSGAGNGGARIMTVAHFSASDDGTASANPATPVTVVINNLSLAGANTTGPGGALGNSGDNVTLQTTHFENNTVAGAGGAVTTTFGGILTVRQSSFVNNTAGTGGSAIVAGGGSGMLTIENSTFSGNKNTGLGANSGGAIDILSGVNTTLTNNTISGNSSAAAGQGGGVLVESSAGLATLTGNIIFGNTSNGVTDDVHTEDPSLVGAGSGFNDIGVYTNIGGAAAALTAGNNGNISADPMLGALTPLANGTRAFTPAAGSPVLNTIAPANAPAVDQANNPRPAGPNSDMGAIEGAAPAAGGGSVASGTTTGTPTSTGTATGTGTSTGTGTGTGTSSEQDLRALINQLVIANLQRVFAQPLPPDGSILSAGIMAIGDLNGDGFADVTAVALLRVGKRQFVLVMLQFDGLNPAGGLLAPPLFLPISLT